MDILIVGSLALDSIKTPFGEVKEAVGGSAVYASIAASYFQRDVFLVGVVGEDFPPAALQLLAEHGINTKGIQIKKGETFRWSGYYDYDLNTAHTLDTRLNVFAGFDPLIPDEYTHAQIVFLANIDPVLQLKVLSQVKQPEFVICDTMNYWIETRRDELQKLFSMVDMVIMNDAEVREYSREPNLIKAARRVLADGPKMIIVKKGEHGAFLFSPQGVFSAPAFPLEEVIDPTGAGDTFAGGLIGALAMQKSLEEHNLRKAIMYGTVMASFNVEDFSINRIGNLTREDINKRFNELKQITSIEKIKI